MDVRFVVMPEQGCQPAHTASGSQRRQGRRRGRTVSRCQDPAPANDATVAASPVDPRGSQLAYSSLDFHSASGRGNDLSQLARYRDPLSLFSCLEGLDPCRAPRPPLTSSHRHSAE